MTSEFFKKASVFLGRFLLGNFFWILPVAWLCAGHKIANIIFYSALVTYGFICGVLYFREKSISIRKTPVWVNRLYFGSVIGFLLITLWSTYQGLKSTFSLTGSTSQVFVFVLSTIICLTLFGITQMVKTRRTPAVLISFIVLYFVLDGLTALPANFLFFYENARKANEVGFNKTRLASALDQCRKYVDRKRDTAQSIVGSRESQALSQQFQDSLARAGALKRGYDALKNLDAHKAEMTEGRYDSLRDEINKKIDALSKNIPQPDPKPATGKRGPPQQKHDTTLEKAINDLAHCKQWDIDLQNAGDIYTRLKKTDLFKESDDLADSMRIELHDIIQGSTDPQLRAYSDSLRSNKPSSIESVKMLYRYIFSGLGIGENHDTLMAAYDPDTPTLILVSLSSSIVIDILPLFLSLLYAKYRAND